MLGFTVADLAGAKLLHQGIAERDEGTQLDAPAQASVNREEELHVVRFVQRGKPPTARGIAFGKGLTFFLVL